MIVTVLTNPMSGHGNAPHASERAVARFQELGIDVVQIVGRDAAHARELVDEALARGTDAFVVVGGDGVIPDRDQSAADTAGASVNSWVLDALSRRARKPQQGAGFRTTHSFDL